MLMKCQGIEARLHFLGSRTTACMHADRMLAFLGVDNAGVNFSWVAWNGDGTGCRMDFDRKESSTVLERFLEQVDEGKFLRICGFYALQNCLILE